MFFCSTVFVAILLLFVADTFPASGLAGATSAAAGIAAADGVTAVVGVTVPMRDCVAADVAAPLRGCVAAATDAAMLACIAAAAAAAAAACLALHLYYHTIKAKIEKNMLNSRFTDSRDMHYADTSQG